MKVLLDKLKKVSKIGKIFYFLCNIMYIVFYFLFVKSLLNLVGIETVIRIILIIIFFIWLIVYFIFGLSTLIKRKYKKFIILTIIEVIFLIILFGSSFIIQKFYSKIEMITNQEYTTYETNLISLKDTELKSNSKIGMIDNKEDIEGYILANKLKDKENIKGEIKYFDDYYIMLNSLYNKEIDAVFVSSNYVIIFGNEEQFERIGSETKVLAKYSEEMKTKSITNSNKKLTEPFSILLMGVDSEIDGLNANAAFNGDTLMLVTFNPNTLTATMFSIPRDTYVPIACNRNRSHKINSSAAYGTECVINTVKNLVGIDIDYYAKINFNGVVDLINALGGIDVDVEQPDYIYYVKQYGKGRLCEENSARDSTNLICMNTGMQHLNGEQTLAYARNRHGFLASDLARNRHQQQIVEALAKKLMTVSSFSDFENLLDVVGKNIATNLTSTQILSFYQTLKNMLMETLKGNDFINIQKTYLEVYNLPVMISGLQLSALGYYENSLKEIKTALEVNLGIKKEEMIKTFSYDYNESYESPIIGKGVTGAKNEATVPNLIGSTVPKAEEWASSNGITLIKEFTCSDGIPGIIGNQNVSIGTGIKSINSITIYINESCPTKPDGSNETEDPTNDEEKPEQPSDSPEEKPSPEKPEQPETPNKPIEPEISGIPKEEN